MTKKNIGSAKVKQKASKESAKENIATIQQSGITEEERHQLISKEAYYRAERRGFNPGAELDDWLSAEAQIDKTLRGH